jgi:hypothetical protein
MNPHSPQLRDETMTTRQGAARRSRPIRLMTFALLLASVLAACGTASTTPVTKFTKGDELAYYDFSQPGTFEEGAYADGNVRMEVREGQYHMDLSVGDSVLWYGQWGDTLRDVVIDVEAQQTTESQNTTYGVMCRARGAIGQALAKPEVDLAALASESSSPLIASAAQALEGTQPAEATAEATSEATKETTPEPTAEATKESTAEATAEATQEATPEPTAVATAEATPEATAEATSETGAPSTLDTTNVNNGDGYLFLIEGTGRFAIMRSRGRNVTPLVDWTASSTIKSGPAKNTIRAVCMGNYLALYINGEFMADTSDDTYNKGQIGLVAAAANRLGNQVEFDNLSVYEAKPG